MGRGPPSADVFKANSSGETPAYARTGRRRGSPRTRRARLVDLGHRSPSRARPRDGARLPCRRADARRPEAGRPDPLEPFVSYLAARFADDPHLWLTALFDEVVRLGYRRSYPSFARGVRRAGLRPTASRAAA